MKIKISKNKQVLKESKQKEKNFFRSGDFSQEYVNQVIREEFENVINEEINPLEIKRAICDKKDMIVGAIKDGKVNNLLWWAEALGMVPEEMEQARETLENLLGTDPDKILQTPGAKEGAVAAIELMCMIPLEESLGVGIASSAAKEAGWRRDPRVRAVLDPIDAVRQYLDRNPSPRAAYRGKASSTSINDGDLEDRLDKIEKRFEELKAKFDRTEYPVKISFRKQITSLYRKSLAPLIGKIVVAINNPDEDSFFDDVDDLKELRKRARNLSARMRIVMMSKQSTEFDAQLDAAKSKDDSGGGKYGDPGFSLGPVRQVGREAYRQFYRDVDRLGVKDLLGKKDFVWGPKHQRAYDAMVKKMK